MRLALKLEDRATRSRPPATLAAALALALLCGVATPVAGQIGLAEQAAVSGIQNELQNGSAKAVGEAAPPVQPAAEATPPAPEGAPAEGTDPAASPQAAPAATESVSDKWNDSHSIFRQRELSLSWWKFLLVLLLYFAWVRSCDWVNRSAQIYELGHDTWNPAMVAPFAAAFLLLALIPVFALGLAALALAWLVPFVAYVLHHNNSVEEHQTVFTPQWFRFQAAELGRAMGMKIAAEKQADYERGPKVDLSARGGDDRTAQANLLTARQSPGYVLVKELVSEMVDRGSNRVLMDYTSDVVGVRHMIDGVWHNGESRDRESGDVLLAVMKQLANLNAAERKKKQEGEFGAGYSGAKYDCEVASQGVKTGERVVVSLRGGKLRTKFSTLTELGMREKLREQWLEVMNSERGLIVFSAMPEGGLSTLADVGLIETDRLLRDFIAVEDVADPQTEIENVPPHTYDSAKGQSPAAIIPSLSRKYPNVWVVRDLVDADTAKLMMGEIALDRLVVTTVHAKEAAEACLRMLQKKVPHKDLAANLIGVVNTRLIRTLCPDCKVEIEATPTLLKKLGIPPGKVAKFYQPPKPEEVDKPCRACSGVGFRGRTGIFEVLIVDDNFREKLLKDPTIEALRAAARSAGMRSLQEEGVLLVAKGTTSLSELSRVLKG